MSLDFNKCINVEGVIVPVSPCPYTASPAGLSCVVAYKESLCWLDLSGLSPLPCGLSLSASFGPFVSLYVDSALVDDYE